MFEHINQLLQSEGLLMREGTMVDATIDAPSSTKNTEKARDPEMHQSKKGNQWYFALKAHIGADIRSGLVHSVHTTAANEADGSQTEQVLHGEEQSVWADAGCIGADKREQLKDTAIDWKIAMKRGQEKSLKKAANCAEWSKRSKRSRPRFARGSSMPSTSDDC